MTDSSKYDAPSLGDALFESPVETTGFVSDTDRVLVDPTIAGCTGCESSPPSLEAAGPRQKIFHDPAETRAAIVTCGGLCPGLNDVIRSIVMVSWHRYGVRDILGIRYGYEGLTESGDEPLSLDPEMVEDIHQDGGTILGTSRGPREPAEMVDFLVKRDINILFTVGGDGTQRGSLSIVKEIQERGLPISVVGIPKTIDNDIAFTERTFGFETAVSSSQAAICGAHMEARSARNGIGLVKLMGRHSGFVAVYASLASSDVNLVLIPECPFSLAPVMTYLEQRLGNDEKGHAVVVVAEGAGQDLVSVDDKDASGNKVLGDIGVFMKSAILDHFKAKGMPITVKYIDPSYIIRSAPATPDDSVFCFRLGADAVHAAMAGRTGIVVCLWNGRSVHVPTELAIRATKQVDTHGLVWQSVLDNTGQPRELV